MKNIKEALDEYASKGNEKYALDAWTEDYTNGFMACTNLLLPLVDALENANYTIHNEFCATFNMCDECHDLCKEPRQALADLKAKIGVTNE